MRSPGLPCDPILYSIRRWGRTPLQDATRFGHTKVAEYLKVHTAEVPGTEEEEVAKDE